MRDYWLSKLFFDLQHPAAAAEMRTWLAAHGAARARGFDLIHYSAIAEVYVGCGFACWSPQQQ